MRLEFIRTAALHIDFSPSAAFRRSSKGQFAHSFDFSAFAPLLRWLCVRVSSTCRSLCHWPRTFPLCRIFAPDCGRRCWPRPFATVAPSSPISPPPTNDCGTDMCGARNRFQAIKQRAIKNKRRQQDCPPHSLCFSRAAPETPSFASNPIVFGPDWNVKYQSLAFSTSLLELELEFAVDA